MTTDPSGRPGLTKDGSLILRVVTVDTKTLYAERRTGGGYGPWKEIRTLGEADFPTLTLDGQRVAYVSHKAKVDEARIHDLATGLDRMVYETPAGILTVCGLSPVEPMLYCGERQPSKNATLLVKIPLNGGAPEPLTSLAGDQWMGLTTDGRGLLVTRRDGDKAISYYDFATGKVTIQPGTGLSSANLRWVAREQIGPHRLELRPMAETEGWKPLVTLNSTTGAGLRPSRDGEWLVYLDSAVPQTNQQMGVYVLPLAGGEAVRVGGYAGPLTVVPMFSASSGANRVTVKYVAGSHTRAVAVVKNFLPKVQK